MSLLNHDSLERSSIVANSRMNRERRAVGVNSYQKELGLDPIAHLTERVQATGAGSWLDLCCGRGRALIDAAEHFRRLGLHAAIALHGVDLVDLFDQVDEDPSGLRLETASLHRWTAPRCYDLITCVHGLHYLGDKLALIERAAGWLTPDGLLLANLDLANLRRADGRPLARTIAARLRQQGLDFNPRRHLLACAGQRKVSLHLRYLGANDAAGPNYSGQEAVDSYYETADAE